MPRRRTITPRLARRTLSLGLEGLERLNPRWSARVAERLWFFAGRPPAPSVRNRRPLPAGRPFTVALNKSEIRGMTWGDAEAPAAYLVHGWGGWWQQLGAFVPVLLARGYRPIAFDAVGHGDSGPGAFGRWSTSVPEMAESYRAVAERFGAPAATVAHSLGCLSVVWAQRHHQIVPVRQILIAPAATTQGMLEVFSQSVGIGARTLAPLSARFRTRMGRPLSDFDLLPLVAAEQADHHLPPALIVHDRSDPLTSAKESEALAAQWLNSDLLLTEGNGHYRVLYASETLTAAGDFLGRRD